MFNLSVRFGVSALALCALASAQASVFDLAPFGVSTFAQIAGPTAQGNGVGETVPYGFGSTSQVSFDNTSYDTLTSAYGTASLAGGSIGASAFSSIPVPGSHSFYGGQGEGEAALWDTITVTGTGQNLGLIPLQIALDGSTTGTSSARVEVQVYDLDFQRYVTKVGGNFTADAIIDSDLNFDLPPLMERHYQVYMAIYASAYTGYLTDDTVSSANFGHTVHFNWALPPDATFTSASGVFGPGAMQAVPEPGPLVALAMGAVGLVFRRRR